MNDPALHNHLKKLGFKTDILSLHYIKFKVKINTVNSMNFERPLSVWSGRSKNFDELIFRKDNSHVNALKSIFTCRYDKSLNLNLFIKTFKKYTEEELIIDTEGVKRLLLFTYRRYRNYPTELFFEYLKSSPWISIFSLEEKLFIEILLLKYKDSSKTDYYDSVNKLLGINIETDNLSIKRNKSNRFILDQIWFNVARIDKQFKLYTKVFLTLNKKHDYEYLVNNQELLDYLIKNNIDIDFCQLFKKYGQYRQFNKQKKLIEDGYIDINMRYNKNPIIYYLLETESISCVKHILENGCNINVPFIKKDGSTCNNVLEYLKDKITNGPKCRQKTYSRYLLLVIEHILKIKYNSTLQEFPI